MSQKIIQCNAWINSHMFLVTLAALTAGFFIRIPDSPALRIAVVALFGYMTFVTSLTISVKSFISVLNQPWLPLWSLFLIHIGSPLIAWVAGAVFYADDPNTRLAYLIFAALPVGVTSVIWASITRGNVALSLVTVTLDTLIVPVFLPLYLKLIIGQTIELSYGTMMLELLLMITLPSLLGMALHDWTQGRIAAFAKGSGGLLSKAGFFIVIFINATLVAPEIAWNGSMLKILLVTFLVVIAGYYLGYLGSLAVKGRPRDVQMAMLYNVGLRNLSFGLVLALTYFPPAVAIPMTMGILYQQPVAAIIPFLLKKPPAEAESVTPES
ncbi:MAG: bile acid:sodium symporter family protein [Sporomusaceae bacterium]|nr:bile acid:sodium symporter family protein [Sporomusaceae bacterium]